MSGELCISTLTLNGEALSRKVEVATPEELAETLASRGGEIAVTADLDLTTAQAVQVNYPTVAYARPRDEDNGLVQQAEQLLGSHGFGPRLHYGRLRPDPELRGAYLTIDGGATLETTNNQQGSGILNNGGKVVLADCTVNAAFFTPLPTRAAAR